MEKLNFWTPVRFDNHTKINYLLEKVDSYFYLGGKTARVISGYSKKGQEGVVLEDDKPLWAALKVASYFTLILPLILLAAKYVLRRMHPFHVVDKDKIPAQTEEAMKVCSYTGDLSDKEKTTVKAVYLDKAHLQISLPHSDLNITIRAEELFQSKAQVIVNAANTHLGGGGGIDGAIHDEGGKTYSRAHKKLRDKYNAKYVSGHAALISSGDLKAKYSIENVIVVAGPQVKTKESELYSCYYNSLKLADGLGKTSIAFPSISTGIFGFPKDRAAHISLKAIFDFSAHNPKTNLKTISIHFLPKQEAYLEFYKTSLEAV